METGDPTTVAIVLHLQSLLELERPSMGDAISRIESPDRTTEHASNQPEWLAPHDQLKVKPGAMAKRPSSLDERPRSDPPRERRSLAGAWRVMSSDDQPYRGLPRRSFTG